jgi:hypothetical protein
MRAVPLCPIEPRETIQLGGFCTEGISGVYPLSKNEVQIEVGGFLLRPNIWYPDPQ